MPQRIASTARAPSAGLALFPISSSPCPDSSSTRPQSARDVLDSSEEAVLEWTEEEIVHLHWRLLQDVQHLADPAAPLDEKLSTLRWVFTEPHKDEQPFSFVNCLRVVGCSPLSPIAYCGSVDAQEIRDQIACHVRRWLIETLANYPPWVAQALAANPLWFEAELARNPQWINEQVKRLCTQGDLFGASQPWLSSVEEPLAQERSS